MSRALVPLPFSPRVDLEDPRARLDRRGWLRAAIGIVAGAISSTLAVVAGGAVLAPSFATARERWVPAGRLRDLEDRVPTPVTVRVRRQDGYYETIEQQVVYLIRSGSGDVHALSSTCTHLGCRTRYDAEKKLITCPCHGGVYGPDGRVLAGPPPRSLPRLPVRVDGAQVLVQV